MSLAGLVCDNTLVFPDLEKVQAEGQGSSEGKGNVGQARCTFAPTALLLVGDGDHREEEECKEPGETDPETEGKDDGLGEEHMNGLNRGVVQHVFDTGGFELAVCNESIVSSVLAKHLGPLAESDTTASLPKENNNHDTQGNIGKALNSLNPAPTKGLVDEAGVNGGGDGSENRDERERRHRNSTVSGCIHVSEGTTDQDGSDTAKKTEKTTADQDRGDIFAEREADEHQGETDVRSDIDNTTTCQLTEWRQEQRCEGTSEVETEKTQLTDFR